ncbi:hypothetical protein CfE428DRAFT_5816 [Chthoniobacter flavus Ellin428]|uniref:Uncharacterized protein n=1 Tax=Chthoniobacter flavus Ellin428 TaxID=497964 RepID=B4DA76_9BACT|nr:hypothetical protein [Chthoniobacter flavus]EDY16703.1 hypothetical protein CfE428DRAFT_5816 [Chthoniobacter flavus Ellin428]TCO87268.1 hypothetical protein EV701_123105 [Chthoniobacter flavus]
MKTSALFITLLTAASIAASSLTGHQAFGPLRFGMPAKEADQTFRQMHRTKDPHQMTAAEARAHFVTNGAMKLSRMEDYDRALPVYINFHGEPFMNEVAMESMGARVDTYDGLKKVWEDFQDFGDCKFTRKSEKGSFCPITSVDAATVDESTHLKSVVTDVWETEGVRIELSVQYIDIAGVRKSLNLPPMEHISAPPYRVALTAKQIAPAK